MCGPWEGEAEPAKCGSLNPLCVKNTWCKAPPLHSDWNWKWHMSPHLLIITKSNKLLQEVCLSREKMLWNMYLWFWWSIKHRTFLLYGQNNPVHNIYYVIISEFCFLSLLNVFCAFYFKICIGMSRYEKARLMVFYLTLCSNLSFPGYWKYIPLPFIKWSVNVNAPI